MDYTHITNNYYMFMKLSQQVVINTFLSLSQTRKMCIFNIRQRELHKQHIIMFLLSTQQQSLILS